MTREPGLDDFDADIYANLERNRRRLVDLGVDADEADIRLKDAIRHAAEDSAPNVAKNFKEGSPKLLGEIAAYEQSVRDDVRAKWGEHLDRFAVIKHLCEEKSGHSYDARIALNPDGSPMLFALTQLSAVAVRISSEICHLLSNGFPDAALARSRALYEVFVTALVLAEHGHLPGNEQLAERYLTHSLVDRYWNAKEVYDDPVASDDEKPTDEEIAELKAEYDTLMKLYKPSFRTEWGWAMPLFKDANECRFSNIEKLVDIEGHRRSYAHASNVVHGNSRGTAANLEAVPGRPEAIYMVTGHRLDGFVLPLELSLIYLVGTTAAMMFGSELGGESPSDHLMVEAIRILMSDAMNALDEVEG